MYPRRDAPLVPSALIPFIGDEKVYPTVVRRYGLPDGLRLRDLDESVWIRFPPESIHALVDQVISSTRHVEHELASSKSTVRIDPTGEDLSGRARNALIRAGLLGTPWSDEVPLSDLVHESGVGAKTLLEWLVASDSLDAVADGPKSQQERQGAARKVSRAVRQAAELVQRSRWAKEISVNDPRLGRRVAELNPQAATAFDAAQRLAERPLDRATARRKARQLRELRSTVALLKRLSLEDEIDEVIAASLPASEAGREGVKLRLGLFGEEPTTLAVAGEAVGLTRERVRQLERRLRDVVGQAKPWMPVLEKVVREAQLRIPATGADILKELVEKGLLRDGFSMRSLVTAADVFERERAFRYDERSGLVYRDGTLGPMETIGREARRLTTHWGASTVDALLAELGEPRGLDRALLRLQLETIPNFHWLDDEKEWFWIKGTVRNRLLNQIEKIMSVAGSIDIGELRDGVGRWYRMEGFRPPREVLARLCEQSGEYVRNGDMIIEGPGLRPWNEVLQGTVERGIAEVLFEFGPLMRRDELERLAVDERGLNRSSFNVYLGNSPIIAHYGPSVYGLRGARVTAGEVNALIPRRVATRRLIDDGWTEDGRVWIAFRLSSAAIQSGVLTVPARLQDLISGSYVLHSDHDRPVGTLVAKESRMWGVGPFYRRSGVEEGDYLVITIDIDGGRATITAGDAELLARFQGVE